MGSTCLTLLNKASLLNYINKMKVSTSLKALKGVTPQLLAASGDSLVAAHTGTANNFAKVYSPLSNKEKVLEFGCMTGETANAIAKGELGNLGKPASVVGTDVPVMTDHCKSAYNTSNLSFKSISEVESNPGKMDLITTFSYIQEVENQPKTIQMFNKMLNKGGKFAFFVKTNQNAETSAMRKEFEAMKGEAKWSKMLSKTAWPVFGTQHKNNSWLSTVDHNGRGAMTEGDYIKLMEANGFKVAFTASKTVNFTLSEDFMRNYFKTVFVPALSDMKENDKQQFLEEFVRRVRSQRPLNSEGNYEVQVDGFDIIGEKQ